MLEKIFKFNNSYSRKRIQINLSSGLSMFFVRESKSQRHLSSVTSRCRCWTPLWCTSQTTRPTRSDGSSTQSRRRCDPWSPAPWGRWTRRSPGAAPWRWWRRRGHTVATVTKIDIEHRDVSSSFGSVVIYVAVPSRAVKKFISGFGELLENKERLGKYTKTGVKNNFFSQLILSGRAKARSFFRSRQQLRFLLKA